MVRERVERVFWYIDQSCKGLSWGHRCAEERHSLQGFDGWHKVTESTVLITQGGMRLSLSTLRWKIVEPRPPVVFSAEVQKAL